MVALALCLGACGDDDDPGDATPTTTEPATSTSTTTTAPEPTDEEAVTQLVEEWWQVSREIASGDRDIEEASEFAAGDYLDGYVAGANEYFADGFIAELTDRSSVRVEDVKVEGDTAEVTVCIVNGDHKVIAATGEVEDDSVNASRYTDELSRTADGWRIVMRGRLDSWEDASSCDEP